MHFVLGRTAPSPESKSPTREAGRLPAGASAALRGAVCHSASGAGVREASSPTKEDVRGHPGPSARAVVVV